MIFFDIQNSLCIRYTFCLSILNRFFNRGINSFYSVAIQLTHRPLSCWKKTVSLFCSFIKATHVFFLFFVFFLYGCTLCSHFFQLFKQEIFDFYADICDADYPLDSCVFFVHDSIMRVLYCVFGMVSSVLPWEIRLLSVCLKRRLVRVMRLL